MICFRQYLRQKGVDVKKIMSAVLIVLFVLVLLGTAGVLLFRRLVTDQIADWGGMENLDSVPEDELILDGGNTYAENETLLECLIGRWKSTDGRFEITIGEDYGITVTFEGKAMLDDTLEFVYLQPNEDACTELSLKSENYNLRSVGGDEIYTVSSLEHEFSEGEHGKIRMGLFCANGQTQTVTFEYQ